MSRHAYDISLPAFRPSVYSTGLQSSQPYTKQWEEHGAYGAWYDWLTSPVSTYLTPLAKTAEAEGAVSGTCADHSGLLGVKGARVSCAALSDAMKGNRAGTTHSYNADAPVNLTSFIPPSLKPDILLNQDEKALDRKRKEEEAAAEQRATMFKVGGALVLGIGGFVLVQRYRKTGKIL